MLLNEIKHTHRRPVSRDTEYGVDAGRYIGLHFNPESKDLIKRIANDETIPNAVPPEKLHTTITYSKDNDVKDYSVDGQLQKPICAKIDSFDVFPSQEGKNCLVAKLDCPDCIDKHNKTRELGASYDYDDYIPHITLSYDAGDVDMDKLENLTKKYRGMEIYADEEYDEPLKNNWAKDL